MFDSSLPPAPGERRAAVAVADGPLLGDIDFALIEGGPELATVRDDAADPAAAWWRVAERDQDRLDDLEIMARLAEVARTEALLQSYETSMRDLELRKGARMSGRGSSGAAAFFKSTGLRIGMSPNRVAHLVDTSLFLRDALPITWSAYCAGRAGWWAADLAAHEGVGLDDAARAAYDSEAAEALTSTPVRELKRKLRRIRERLQDGTAGERAKRTAEQRHVVVDHGRDGEASIIITGPALPIVAFDEALTKAAIAAHGAEDETRTIGQLRHDIAVDLLVEGVKQAADPARVGVGVPQRKGVVPAPVLTIPLLAALGHSGEQAHLVGYGPLDLETAEQAAGSATTFLRVLTDPFTGVRIDMERTKRVAPADMRRWVAFRDELCRFPGCTRPAHLCDQDHVQTWLDAGVTAVDNLMCDPAPDAFLPDQEPVDCPF